MQELAADERRWAGEGLTGLGAGWAIGSRGWMMALAKEHDRPGIAVGLLKEERVKLRKARWQAANLHLGGAATLRGYLHCRKSGTR